MRSRIILLIVLFAVALFFGCSSDEKPAKSMTELQKENGIPVVLKEIKPEYFAKEMNFYSQISGIKQTTRSSAVGGRIEKINYKVGDFVKKDAVVVQFPEDSPSVQYEQAKAAYENSKKTFERMKALLTAGETSQANFDGAETQYLVDKRNYEMARQALFIDAPYDGTIVEIMVNEGDGVDSKIPLFTIAKLEKMKTKIWASEDEITLIKKGMKAEVNFNGKTVDGMVTEISLSIDPMKRAFYAEIEFQNPGRVLSPGVSADINVKIYENKNAIVIPRNLIQTKQNKNYVFVASGSKASKREIKIGKESGLSVEVLQGLKSGDLLVIKGGSKLSDGQLINVVK